MPVGARNAARFLQGLRPRCNTGPGVSAFAVYMTQYQLLPYQRTAEVLNERAGLGTSPGILQRAVRVAATRLETTANAIRRALVAAPVAHANETSRRVPGDNNPAVTRPANAQIQAESLPVSYTHLTLPTKRIV